MTAVLSRDLGLEAEGGAVPLDSRFYIQRPSDAEFRGAVARGDGIVLVKGPRQVGKTSLLARGLQEARSAGARVVLIDFQTLDVRDLESADSLAQAMAGLIAEGLDLDDYPEDGWEQARGANVNLTRYLAGCVLERVPGQLVLALDEVDRLFTTQYSDDIFAMFRGWHNRRALDPEGPWNRLTLAISFATEAHLFIRDLNQSPFNVGTRVALRDFTAEEVRDLNERYGGPLRSDAEVQRFYRLLSGHPFLTRKGLNHLATSGSGLDALESRSTSGEGPFGDHLKRMLILLARDPEICADLTRFIREQAALPCTSFHRLRGAGVLSGGDSADAAARCELYRRYLDSHLGCPR